MEHLTEVDQEAFEAFFEDLKETRQILLARITKPVTIGKNSAKLVVEIEFED